MLMIFFVCFFVMILCRCVLMDVLCGSLYIGDSWCRGFRCVKSGYCIASKLRCNKLPNCGRDDNSDETDCKWLHRFRLMASSKRHKSMAKSKFWKMGGAGDAEGIVGAEEKVMSGEGVSICVKKIFFKFWENYAFCVKIFVWLQKCI